MTRVQGFDTAESLKEVCDQPQMKFAGDAIFTDVQTFCEALRRRGE